MFGFGNENKEKLQENMDEIKSMIEDGESLDAGNSQAGVQQNVQSQAAENSEQELTEELQGMEDTEAGQDTETFDQPNQVSDEDVESFEEDFEREFEQQSGNEFESSGAAAQQNSQTQSDLQQPQQNPSQDSNQETWDQNQQRSGPGASGREGPAAESGRVSEGNADTRAASSRDRNVKADIPEPAETREINVPDIEKGPLFIRQQKFEYASRLIQEMRYLANEVENTVNDIEADLQRDQETESQVREILHEFEEDRTEVERIVSPDKE